jgi:hypothetical protein
MRYYKAVPIGIEPMTLRLTAARSNQLSYGTSIYYILLFFKLFLNIIHLQMNS